MEKEMLDLYAPTNAKNLSEEQLAAMANFTKEDLKQLAEAYPNNSHMNAYLILHQKGTKDNKQVGHPSTWNNLYQLVKMGNTNYYAVSFRTIYKGASSVKSQPVQKAKDITNDEAKNKLKAVPQQAKEITGEPVKEKTAAEIAAEEGKNIGGNKGDKPEKPLNKMNVAELTAKYKELFEEDPEEGSTKGQLIAAIQSKK